MKNIVVRQNDISDCGACCLESIIKYYDGYIPLEKIKNDTRTNRNGTTAFNIINASKKYGFESFGLKTENINQELLPVIAHTSYNNLLHFVVVYKIDKKYYYLMDPAKGYTKLKKAEFQQIWTNIILILKPLSHIPKYQEKNILKTIINDIFKSEQKLISNIIITSIIITTLSIILSYQFKITSTSIESNTFQATIFISLIFIILSLIKTYLSYKQTEYEIYLNKNINLKVIVPFINHIFNLPLNVIKTKSQGEMITRFNELNNIKDIISEVFITVFLELTLSLCTIYILYNICSKLFLILCIVSIIYIIIGVVYSPSIYQKINDNIDIETEFTSEFLEKISSIDTVKNLNITSTVQNKIKDKYCDYLSDSLNFNKFTNKYNGLKEIFGESSLVLINTIGFIFVYNNTISLLDLITFVSLLVYYFNPIKNCIDLLPKLNLIKISINKINEFYYLEEEKIGKTEEFSNGTILINNLCYSYDDYHNLLNNINIKINKNERIILKGKSGCGKSTLCQILNKTINNYSGSITIDNINIKDYSIKTIKQNIRYVSQKERLFTDTIENNITLGKKYNKKNLIKIIKLTRVNQIIEKRPLRLNTLLIDSGSNLSGGERQRIVLARAILNSPKILILDESLNEVDEILEKKILDDISEFLSNTTIIYISHHKSIPNYRIINLESVT